MERLKTGIETETKIKKEIETGEVKKVKVEGGRMMMVVKYPVPLQR